jgi:hypothetical protein
MTKFYFIVREAGQVYQDTSGYGMDSLEKALKEAALLAVSLAKDHVAHDTNQAVCVEVLDDEGEMLGKSTCVVMVETNHLVSPRDFIPTAAEMAEHLISNRYSDDRDSSALL